MADKSKINRDAFLYLSPNEKSYASPEDYTKCKTCTLWTGEDRKRCFILGKKLEVLGTDTCLYYCNGEPQIQLSGQEVESVTSKESGFYKELVQCKRCSYFNPLISRCKLFFILETEFPDEFDLDGSSVDKNACCNGFLRKDSKVKKKDAIGQYIKKVLNKNVNFEDLLK